MKVTHFNNVSQFYALVESYLLLHESQHNLILGILNNLISSRDRFTHQPYLATATDDDILVAVAVMTPPFKLLLSQATDLQAIREIAQDPILQSFSVPAVMSFAAEAQTFAQSWQAATGRAYREGLKLSIYQLQAVKSIAQTTGNLQLVNLGDREASPKENRELLIRWFNEFYAETNLEDTLPDIVPIVDNHLQNGTVYLWQDKVPVSMVAISGQTPNGKRIAPVYTPPEYRNKGYATACVAAVSQTLLEQGWRYCFLFADSAYPTANYVYQKVGYQPISDVIEYWFENK